MTLNSFQFDQELSYLQEKQIQNISPLALIIQLMLGYSLLKVESDQNSFSTEISYVFRV